MNEIEIQTESVFKMSASNTTAQTSSASKTGRVIFQSTPCSGVYSGCVYVDERVAIPNSIQHAVLESLHLTQPESWGMITQGQYAFLPHVNREILNKAAKSKLFTEMGKNLKLNNSRHPDENCSELNEETHVHFGGPITSEKDQDIRVLVCIDRFSKYPAVEVFDKAKAPNVVKF